MKRAANNERKTPQDRAILVDEFLIREGELCCYCKDLDCSGRGVKEDCMLWPAYAKAHGIEIKG